MIDNTRIVLYFSEVQKYDINKFAYKLSDNLPELGQVTALPYSMIENISAEEDLPIITFMSSKSVKLIANFNYVSINIYDDSFNISDAIKKIYGVVSEFGFTFYRIGVVIEKKYSSNYINVILEKEIKDKEFYDSKQFILGWHKVIPFRNIDINFWQKYSTDPSIDDSLFAIFDFNTKINQNIIIDIDFALDFINNSKNTIANFLI